MKQSENIEQLFRDSLGNLEADVNPRIWDNIQSQITSGSSANSTNGLLSSLVSKVVVGVLGTAAVITAVVMLNNSNEETKPTGKKPVAVSENTTIVPENNSSKIESNTSLNTSTPTGKEEVNPNTPSITYVPQTVEPVVSNPVQEPKKNTVDNTPKTETPVPNIIKVEKPKVEEPIEPEFVSKLSAQIIVTPSDAFAPAVITFSNKGNGDNMIWDFGDGTAPSLESNPMHVYEKAGKYTITLTIKDDHGNTVTDYETIELKGQDIFLPNSFTPNGDGVNDEYRVTDDVNIASFNIVVQDKNGKVVAQWSTFEGYWDGRNLKGEICPPGTYIYVINYIDKLGDKRQKVGSITVPNQR